MLEKYDGGNSNAIFSIRTTSITVEQQSYPITIPSLRPVLPDDLDSILCCSVHFRGCVNLYGSESLFCNIDSSMVFELYGRRFIMSLYTSVRD